MSIYCERCHIKLDEGLLRYLVTIHVAADFDGVLPGEGEIEDLEAFMRSIDREERDDLDHDVYQSKAFVLCHECKNSFIEAPLGRSGDHGEGAGEGRVH